MGRLQYPLIARIGLCLICYVRWLPYVVGIVYRLLRYLLTHNSLHHLVDHLLLFPVITLIKRLQLITQIPVAQQHLIHGP